MSDDGTNIYKNKSLFFVFPTRFLNIHLNLLTLGMPPKHNNNYRNHLKHDRWVDRCVGVRIKRSKSVILITYNKRVPT